MIKCTRIVFGLFLFFFIVPFLTPALMSKTLILEGREQSTYLLVGIVPGDIQIPDYGNYGYSQSTSLVPGRPDAREITIRVSLEPIFQQVRFDPSNYAVDASVDQRVVAVSDLDTKLRELTRDQHSVSDAVNAVFTWLIQSMTLTTAIEEPRDAHSVFNRGQGNCVDFSNLAHELLRRIGVPSRIVHGLIFKSASEASSAPLTGEFHRWLEVYLAPVGWVFYDPTVSCGFVRSDYLVVHIEGSDLVFPDHLSRSDLVGISERLSRLKNQSAVYVTDCIPEGSGHVLMRRFSVEQNTCSVYGTILFRDGTPYTSGSVTLLGENGLQLSFPLNEQGVFSAYCLEPGTYSVSVGRQGSNVFNQVMQLFVPEVRRLDILLSKSKQGGNFKN